MKTERESKDIMPRKKSHNHKVPDSDISNHMKASNEHAAKDNKNFMKTNTMEMTDSDNDYKFYRTAGLTLSATLIVISGALLNWALTNFEKTTAACPVVKVSFGFLVLFLSLAVCYSLRIQYNHYRGYQAQARKYYPAKDKNSEELQQEANLLFSKAEIDIEKAWKSLFGGFICIIFFFIYK